MKKASYIFIILKEKLHSAEFQKICRVHSSDFTRNRFLTCQVLVLFILNLLKKSIPKEMISFCEYCSINEVSRSAVTQARSKLSPQAFIYLNDSLVHEFYNENSFETFQGLILMAIDGTLLELPMNSSEILERFGYASNQTSTQVPMARASILYDVSNGITIDAILAPYCASERDLAIQHFKKMRATWTSENLQRILVIFDRGYPSAALLIYLIKHNIKFLMRCNTKFMKEVNEVVRKGRNDAIVEFSSERTGAAKEVLQKLFPEKKEEEKLSMRVVVITLSTGEKEILLTSLLDKKKYPFKIFRRLYFKRWRAEENYKFFKLPLEIENFSGKSCRIVEQDFHATILSSNARALLALEATQESIETRICSSERDQKKYIYEINKRISMERLKNEFVAVLLDPCADIEQFCSKIKRMMKRDLVPIRPGRHFKRIRKYETRKYHMNLR